MSTRIAEYRTYGHAETIEKAASRARGDRLGEMYKLCEGQKTISTRKLLKMVEDLQESDRLDAIHFKCLAKRLRSLESN